MNVCVAHLQMNACVAKNFGAWTEKVGHPCPTFMAHPTRVGRRVGALHKKLGHPWCRVSLLQFDGTDFTILIQLPLILLSCVFVSLDKIFHNHCICLMDFKQQIEQEARKVN